MLMKEKGYDEFLAKHIAEGLAEADKGEGLTLEQSKARAMAVLEKNSDDRVWGINLWGCHAGV